MTRFSGYRAALLAAGAAVRWPVVVDADAAVFPASVTVLLMQDEKQKDQDDDDAATLVWILRGLATGIP